VSGVTIWSVYLITHSKTGMRYVGITRRGKDRRWRQHTYEAGRKMPKRKQNPLHDAIRADGKAMFSIETLRSTLCMEKAGMFEKALIKELGTLHPSGYNLTAGGLRGGYHIVARSAEFKERMKAMKDGFWTPERRKVMSEVKKNQYASDPKLRETLAQSQAKGWAKTRGSTYEGRQFSDIAKQHMREAQLRVAATTDGKAHLAHMTARSKAAWKTEKRRESFSAFMKNKWSNDEHFRQRIVTALRRPRKRNQTSSAQVSQG
jgi:hypothetical protein